MKIKDTLWPKRCCLYLSISPGQRQMLTATFIHSTCRTRSEYMRRKLLDEPITINHRNQSLDEFMAEMVVLRKELNAIMIMAKSKTGFPESVEHHLLENITEIKLKINQINDRWLL